MTRPAITFVALAMTLGCVSVRPIASGEVPVLSSGEGILVVHLDSSIPIKKLAIGQATAGWNLTKGEHFYLVAVTAGGHRWSDIVIPAGEGDVPFKMSYDDVWKFRVEAGRINYPGQLVFGGTTQAKVVEISAYTQNRSALALRKLREKFPAILERYPPVYSGPTRDDYLEYYAGRFLTAGDTATASPR